MIFLFSVIIPMAGSGSRAKTSMNKALVMINGKPLFMYAYELFKQFDCEIILVCKEDEIPIVKKYVDNNVIFALGGNTRASSVYNGLLKANYEYVLIPDARFPNEIRKWWQTDFDSITVRIERMNKDDTEYDNGLSEEQKQHPSETELDDWIFNYHVYNKYVTDLQNAARGIFKEMEKM